MHEVLHADSNNTESVTGVEEITPEQSSLSLNTSLKLFITQMHSTKVKPRIPKYKEASYIAGSPEDHTHQPWKIERDDRRDARRRPARSHCSIGTGRRLANWSELPFDQSEAKDTEVQGGKLHRGTARRPRKAKASTVSLLDRDRSETG